MSSLDSAVPSQPAPHESGEAISLRRGHFWLKGEIVSDSDGQRLLGSSFVQWEAPAEPAELPPVVLIHGGGGQGTDWLGTPDGGPGWAQLLVQRGHPVYVVDRPGYGRSAYLPGWQGGSLPPVSYEAAKALFLPEGQAPDGHGAWPWGREPGSAALDNLVASSQPMLVDTRLGHRLERDRLAELLGRIGPAIIITHSAGAPAGWLAADARPELALAIVAVEPLGPPFKDLGPRGSLEWGITALPMACDPPGRADPGAAGKRVLAHLKQIPVAVVSGEASGRAASDAATAGFLQDRGVAAEHIQLRDHGVRGNGHGLIFESNNRESLDVVLRWLQLAVPEQCNAAVSSTTYHE